VGTQLARFASALTLQAVYFENHVTQPSIKWHALGWGSGLQTAGKRRRMQTTHASSHLQSFAPRRWQL